MLDFSDYKDKKIIIYDELTKKTIAETTIVDFNRSNQTVVVDSSRFQSKCSDRVHVLIFGDDGMHEYEGTVRSLNSTTIMGIALYNGKSVENRKYIRYTIHAPAVVEHLVVGNRPVPLQKKCEVDIVNISSTGILIRGNVNLLNIGTTFQLKLTVDGQELYLNATVVRIERSGPEHSEFGCRLNSQYKNNETADSGRDTD